jgi:drug/metabolite transporter (DMT)-like permease
LANEVPNRVVLLGGAAAGVCSFTALITIMQAMAIGPVSFTWVLVNLSIGVPILLSAVFWSEPIRHAQWLGLAFFVVSLILFGKDLQQSGAKEMTLKWALFAAIMFLANGCFLFCLSAVNRYTLVPHTFSTLLTTYVVSGVLLLVQSWRRLARPSARDLKLGLSAAAAMMGGQALIIKALAANTASSLPIIHSSSIIVVAIVSVIMFGEGLSNYSGGGLLCGLVSIVLLTV